MHILFDYQIFTLQSRGGISRYFAELAARLPLHADDIRTTVLAPLHINRYLQAIRGQSPSVAGLSIASFPGKHRVLPVLNRFLSTLYLKRVRPDIRHETYYTTSPLAPALPTVLTVYDMIHERFPQSFCGADRQVAQKKAAAVRRADQIITISQATSRDLQEFLGVAEEKIAVIPLASSFAAEPAVAAAPAGGGPYLLYVGLRGGVKNFASLLEAYAQSRLLRANLHLICAGGGGFTPEERALLEEKGVGGRVLQQEVDDSALKALYAGANVLVYPSLYEGFGLPLLEAMQCGCPIACSNTSSMPEVAGDAACYFPPEEPGAIREVLEALLQSPGELELLREKGLRRASAFTWEACVGKTAAIYRRLV